MSTTRFAFIIMRAVLDCMDRNSLFIHIWKGIIWLLCFYFYTKNVFLNTIMNPLLKNSTIIFHKLEGQFLASRQII